SLHSDGSEALMRTPLLIGLALALAPSARAATYNSGNYNGADLVLADGDVLNGVLDNVGTLTLPAGATAYVAAGVTLELYADTVIIDGVLDATGAGHPGGAFIAGGVAVTGNPGQGPGGGSGGLPGPSLHPGGGAGGSFGGLGGGGAYAFNNAGSLPTTTYGNAGPPFDVAGPLGSGGGGGGTGNPYDGMAGGAGGGSVFIRANWIYVYGSILADGADGDDDTPASREGAGGGGSGGSIVLYGDVGVEGTGVISARGGQGGDDDGQHVNAAGNVLADSY